MAGLELLGDLLVRPDDRLRAVPGATVRLPRDHGRDGGVRSLAAGHRVGLQDAGPDEGVPELHPDLVVAEHAGRSGFVERGSTHRPSGQHRRRREDLGERVAVLDGRDEHGVARLRPQVRDTAGEGPLEPGGQGQRGRRRFDPVTWRRPDGCGKLDQCEGVPECGPEDLLPVVCGQVGGAGVEELAGRGLVQRS